MMTGFPLLPIEVEEDKPENHHGRSTDDHPVHSLHLLLLPFQDNCTRVQNHRKDDTNHDERRTNLSFLKHWDNNRSCQCNIAGICEDIRNPLSLFLIKVHALTL